MRCGFKPQRLSYEPKDQNAVVAAKILQVFLQPDQKRLTQVRRQVAGPLSTRWPKLGPSIVQRAREPVYSGREGSLAISAMGPIL